MRKFSAIIAAALLAFAAPASAANPFTDVPMNHWAYDAIGQLAAHGILSGYPDGTYKGKQPATRYEMASALARALAVTDMTKASRQDAEMLRRLIVEFRDELEALGVKTADIGGRLGVIEDRFGGWRIHGNLKMETELHNNEAPDPDGSIYFYEARLFLERWFGDPDKPMHAVIRIDNDDGNSSYRDAKYGYYYVEMPFVWDSTVTVGRFQWDMGGAYYPGGLDDIAGAGGFVMMDSTLTDRYIEGFGLRKNFSLGTFTAYVAHPDAGFLATKYALDYKALSAWEFFTMTQLQLSERFGLDLGAQAYVDISAGDNSELFSEDRKIGLSFDSLWTVFGGVRFSFSDAVDLRAIIYHQRYNGAEWDSASSAWHDPEADNMNAWRAILYLRQEALKFTSAWLEYGHYDTGFALPLGSRWVVASNVSLGDIIPDDLNYWRVILGQKWNDKWYTHLFFFNYDLDTLDDFKEYGGGITYKLNDSVRFGLNFAKTNWDGDRKDENFILLRTEINF